MGIKQQLSWWRWRRMAQRFPDRFDEWLRDPTRQAGDHELLLAAFLDSGGAALTRASELSAAREGVYGFDDEPSSIGLQPSAPEYAHAITELREQGYTVLPWRLDEDRAARLTEHLSSTELTLISDDPSLDGRSARISYDNPLAEKYDVDVSDILSSHDAVELMLDRGVLRLAQDYLGSVPKIDICASWFSFPVNRASARAATMFHFDLDRTRWLKIFFFLTDVTPTTGAHVFIPGTQRDSAIPVDLRKRGYARMTDGDVRSACPEDLWTTIGGPRGTILLEDTRGIHKGLPVLEGHRLVLQFQYSQDLFGSAPVVLGHALPAAPKFDDFKARYPAVLEGMYGELVRGGAPS
jgi:hypothetical protein